MAEDQEMTVKDLRAEAVKLGMSEEDAATFTTRIQLQNVIKTLEAKPKEEIKKVATIVEKPNPTEDRKVNKLWMGKAEIMREKLLAQPKVRFMIPLDSSKEKPGNVVWRKDRNGKPYQEAIGEGAYETVQINGFKYLVPKGVFVDIPQQVAEILSEGYRLTSQAGQDILLDRIDPETGKTVAESM